MSATHHLAVQRRRTFTFAAALSDDGTPINLTGYTFVLTIKQEAGAATALLTRTLTVDATAGRISCTLTPAQTGAIPAGDHPYDIVMTKPTGEVLTLLEGRAVVEEPVG